MTDMGRKTAPSLPQCEGPKLHPYNPLGTAEIEFLEKIGSGAHSHVAKVRIDRKIFALKIFMNQVIDAGLFPTQEPDARPIDVELLKLEYHPFYAECRAYARLKETEMEHLATKCHGYLNLTDAQEEAAMMLCGEESWWSKYDYEYLNEIERKYYNEPRRAIVKDFVEGDLDLSIGLAKKMKEDLYALHSCGITLRDLKEDAYVAGVLVDFSKAMTTPHQCYDLVFKGQNDPDLAAKNCVFEDLANLEYIFEDWNEAHPDEEQITLKVLPDLPDEIRIMIDESICCTVNDNLETVGSLFHEQRIRCFNPRTVNWRKYGSELRNGEVRAINPIPTERPGSREDQKTSPHTGVTEPAGKDTVEPYKMVKPRKMIDSFLPEFLISLRKYLPWPRS